MEDPFLAGLRGAPSPPPASPPAAPAAPPGPRRAALAAALADEDDEPAGDEKNELEAQLERSRADVADYARRLEARVGAGAAAPAPFRAARVAPTPKLPSPPPPLFDTALPGFANSGG